MSWLNLFGLGSKPAVTAVEREALGTGNQEQTFEYVDAGTMRVQCPKGTEGTFKVSILPIGTQQDGKIVDVYSLAFGTDKNGDRTAREFLAQQPGSFNPLVGRIGLVNIGSEKISQSKDQLTGGVIRRVDITAEKAKLLFEYTPPKGETVTNTLEYTPLVDHRGSVVPQTPHVVLTKNEDGTYSITSTAYVVPSWKDRRDDCARSTKDCCYTTVTTPFAVTWAVLNKTANAISHPKQTYATVAAATGSLRDGFCRLIGGQGAVTLPANDGHDLHKNN